MEGHVVERGDGEDNARVACDETRVSNVMVISLEARWAAIPMMLGQNRKIFSLGPLSEGSVLVAPLPFPFIVTCSVGSSTTTFGDSAAAAAAWAAWRLVCRTDMVMWRTGNCNAAG